MKKTKMILITSVLIIVLGSLFYYFALLTPRERAMNKYKGQCENFESEVVLTPQGDAMSYTVDSAVNLTFPFGDFCIPFSTEFEMTEERILDGIAISVLDETQYRSKWLTIEIESEYSFYEDISLSGQVIYADNGHELRLSLSMEVMENEEIVKRYNSVFIDMNEYDEHIDFVNPIFTKHDYIIGG